jgi:hypothetical protein
MRWTRAALPLCTEPGVSDVPPLSIHYSAMAPHFGLRRKADQGPFASRCSGRCGTGSAESKALQREIIELFLKAGASPKDWDGQGKTFEQCVRSDWIRELL